MWQTKYAAAIPKNLGPKNLGVGVNFRPCSEGFFPFWASVVRALTYLNLMSSLYSIFPGCKGCKIKFDIDKKPSLSNSIFQSWYFKHQVQINKGAFCKEYNANQSLLHFQDFFWIHHGIHKVWVQMVSNSYNCFKCRQEQGQFYRRFVFKWVVEMYNLSFCLFPICHSFVLK